jgi:hypothetical protein
MRRFALVLALAEPFSVQTQLLKQTGLTSPEHDSNRLFLNCYAMLCTLSGFAVSFLDRPVTCAVQLCRRMYPTYVA